MQQDEQRTFRAIACFLNLLFSDVFVAVAVVVCFKLHDAQLVYLLTIYFADVETEDDEVSASVLKVKPVVVPESLVPALTDKTFDVIKRENDLLVVDFFQPCKL